MKLRTHKKRHNDKNRKSEDKEPEFIRQEELQIKTQKNQRDRHINKGQKHKY